MSHNMRVLVVGAGLIAGEYVKVLQALGHNPLVVGRGEEKLSVLRNQYPGVEAAGGGLDQWLQQNEAPSHAIVATPVETLAECVRLLLNAGTGAILVEKPLTFSHAEAARLASLAKEKGAAVQVAYNRRSYASVTRAKELIAADGGVTSFHFNFTEALFRIDPARYHYDTLSHWGLANSSHVIDTAFYLCGFPESINCSANGQGISWHPSGTVFTGSGMAGKSPFSYHADWGAPGRWNIEIMTPHRKLMFSPMERLKQQPENSFAVEEVDAGYQADTDFKPGFFRQTQRFLEGEDIFPLPDLQAEIILLNKIFNYRD